MMISKTKALLIWVLLGSVAQAEVPAPLALVQAERDGPAGREQTTLVFDAKRVRYVTNSNFLQSEPQRAVLGQFESPYTPALEKVRTQLRAQRAEIEKAPLAPPKGYVSPHEIRIYLGTQSIPANSPVYMKLMEFLVASPRLAKWTATDGAELTYREGLQASMQKFAPGATAAKSPKRDVNCQNPGQDVVCRVEGLGQAWFKRVVVTKSP